MIQSIRRQNVHHASTLHSREYLWLNPQENLCPSSNATSNLAPPPVPCLLSKRSAPPQKLRCVIPNPPPTPRSWPHGAPGSPLIIWALACATHLGTFAYSLAEDQRNPPQPRKQKPQRLPLLPEHMGRRLVPGHLQRVVPHRTAPARRRVRILQLLGVHAPPLNDQR